MMDHNYKQKVLLAVGSHFIHDEDYRLQASGWVSKGLAGTQRPALPLLSI